MTNTEILKLLERALDVLVRIEPSETICSHADHWHGVVDDLDIHSELCLEMQSVLKQFGITIPIPIHQRGCSFG